MKAFLVAAALSALAASLSFAAPACATGTYASYIALGAGGCAYGSVTFSNFSGLSFANSDPGVVTFNPNQIIITPGVITGAAALTFSFTDPTVLAGGGTAYDVTVGASKIFTMTLNYLATSNGQPIATITPQAVIGTTGNGSASLTKNVFNGGTSVGSANASDQGLQPTFPTTVTGPSIAVNLNAASVYDSVSLQGQNGTASDRSFTNLFVVPEPMSMGLMGFGLLALGVLGRRLKK